MQRIAVLTSGGDAPGMNAAIRAVVRKALYHGLEVMGIKRGYSGFVEADIEPMNLRSVTDIIHRGGTILHTARNEQFKTVQGRAMAWENVERFGIQGLVVIGGDGSFQGALALNREYHLPVICLPGTIDNDICGTDYTIGFDTALNSVVEAINKIRDTASAHERTFVIEVMGRETGLIALHSGLAGGAESIIIPEYNYDIEKICTRLIRSYRQGSSHSIIVVAEGAASGVDIGREIKQRTGFDTKVTILGHLQRGGNPSAFDRILASMMGSKAVELLMSGDDKKMVGYTAGKVVVLDLEQASSRKKKIDLEMYSLAGILSM
ncbi:MAG TPA: 6-phosphofructokinase [Desulfotomaculum sp.]|nr:MAG: 6-phosphofructokinase [Desulfotomaculum sp. 46_80]KUK85032.1 MAG: 6-phosphofructokinase [Desulfofundulus kuznetsovii]HAG10911.1 6-phosphofructokinase [Desulfotomaculum sp.]HBY03982.1 6-phosphofructokinase [Desulfotomaculum sp.]